MIRAARLLARRYGVKENVYAGVVGRIALAVESFVVSIKVVADMIDMKSFRTEPGPEWQMFSK